MINPSENENPLDSQIIDELQERLAALASIDGATHLTRDRAIRLLKAFVETLGPRLHIPLGELDTGEVIVTVHAGINLLNELIDAISDLDNGKTHAALKVASYGANRSLERWQAHDDQALVEAVLVVQRHRGLKSRREAELIVAKALQTRGKTRKGKAITPKLLKSLRDRQTMRSRQKSAALP